MTPHETFQKFIARQLSLVHESGGVTRFELYHAAGDTSERIQMFPVVVGESTSEDLATDILDVATQDRNARASSQPERYGLAAFIEGDEQPVGQSIITLEGTKSLSTLATTFEDTEPPNAKGVTGQLMRHLEQTQKTMLGIVDVTTGRLMHDLSAARAENAQLRAQHEEVRALREEALDGKQARELQGAQAIQKAKRIDQIGGMLVTMVPMVLSSFFSAKGKPGAQASAMEQAIKALLGNLNEKEITGIFSSLSQPNQMALMQLYKTFKDEVKLEDKGKPKILQACEDAA
jgi:hypothetical protein